MNLSFSNQINCNDSLRTGLSEMTRWELVPATHTFTYCIIFIFLVALSHLIGHRALILFFFFLFLFFLYLFYSFYIFIFFFFSYVC